MTLRIYAACGVFNTIGWMTEKRVPVQEEEGEIRYQLTTYRLMSAETQTTNVKKPASFTMMHLIAR